MEGFRKVKRLITLLTLLFAAGMLAFAPQNANAAAISSTKTGNWNDPTVWSTATVPTAGDAVTIAHIVSMNANATVASLTINSGATLQFNDAATSYTLELADGSVVTINGTLDMGKLGALMTGTTGTATVTMGATGNLKTSNLTGDPVGALGPGAGASLQEQGTGAFNLTSLETSGSVTYNGLASSAHVVTDRNYNILYINNTTSTFTWTLAADRTIRGAGNAVFNIAALRLTLIGGHNITLTGGGLNNNSGGAGVLDAGGGSIIFTGTGIQYISANHPLSQPTLFQNTNLILNNGPGGSVVGNGRPITINGSVTINSGLFNTGGYITTVSGPIVNNDRMTLSNALALGGNFTNNGTFTGGANIVTLNGGAPQAIGGTAATTTFGGLTINNLNGVTLNQNATVTSSVGLTAGVFTLTNPLTINNAATITRTGAGSFAGTPNFVGTVNLTYANSATNPIITPGTELPASTTALNNFTVNATTVNLASDLNANGALTLSGTTAALNAGTFNTFVKGTWTNSASLTAFNSGTGTVTWNGVNASIAGSFATTFNNLTVNIPAANTLTFTTAPTVNGDFTIASGIVGLGTQTPSFKGAFINNAAAAPFTAGTGGVQFNGTVPQTTGGSFATTFPRLTLNNAAGLTLGNNATVTTALTLTNGALTTGANTLALSAATTTVTRTNGFVEGNFAKAFTAGSNSTKVFEIGSGSSYAPISVTFPSITTAGSLMASTAGSEHLDVANSGLDATKNVNRYWRMTNAGLAFNNYNATLTFSPADVDPAADFNVFEVRKLDGANWSPTTTGTRTATSTQATGLTSFSDFAVGTVIPTTPAAPVLVTPVNGATNQSITPTLTWNSTYGADSYGLEVATDAAFTNVVISQTGLTATSYAVTAPLNNSTNYYWHVNATNLAGTGAWSSDWNFTTIIAAPAAPTLASPTNGQTEVSTAPILTWNAAPTADSYDLQVATDAAFTNVVISQTGLTATSYAVTPPLGTSSTYYWRVDATNVGGTSAWSDVWNFTTTLTAPAAPTLASPANGAINLSVQPTLSWNVVPGANSYDLQVATDAGFGTLVVNESGLTGTSLAPATPLAANTTHYWRLNATNTGGTSGWSAEWNFTTRAPATITSTKIGNWNDPTAWNTGYVPGAGDAVVIAHTITMNTDAVIGNLTINSTLQFTNTTTAFTLAFGPASVITVNGNLDMGRLGVLMTGTTGTTTVTMGANGNLKTSNLTGDPVGALGPGPGASLQEQGTGVFNLTSLETSGSVTYNGLANSAHVVTDRNYNILYVNNTSATFTWTLAADRTIRGAGNAVFNVAALRLTLIGGHNITLTAGGLNNNSGGAGVLDAGGGSIIFTGTGIQYISANHPLFQATTFANTNLIVNNGSGGSVVGNGRPIIIDGSVTVNSGLFNTNGQINTVTGSMVNNDRVTLTNALSLGGNFTNNGTFTGGTNIVTLNGAAPQTIGGSAATTFGGLKINNAAGVNLEASPTVNGTLTLTTGNVNTGANSLIIGSAGTVARTAGHIVGNLRKNFNTGSNLTKNFEVGTGADYTPMSLTFPSVTTAGGVTATTVASEHPGITTSGLDATKSVNRHWTLNNNGLGFTTSDATFNFVPTDVDAGANTANFEVHKYDGATWSVPTVGTRTATSTQALGMTSLSDFAIGELPPANTAPVASSVTITGTPEAGQLLTGTYNYSDVDGDLEGTSTFRWLRNDVEIAGANAATYTLVAADVDASIKFEVTPVAQSGVTPGLPVQSPAVGPILPANTAPVASNVAITGTPEAGQLLTGSYTYSDVDGDLEGVSTLRWLRNDVEIAGATAATYTLVAADVGASIKFEVTPVAQTGVTPGLPAQSPAVGPILPANTAPVASNVAITGTPEAGQLLTGSYTYSDADNDLEGVSTFRWLRNDVEIAGANAATYTLVAADVDASIKFEVTPVAQSGVTPGLPVQSPAVGPILPANTAPVASNVAITGTPEAGQLLTGTYNYSDVDGDLEGTSTFRWLRNDVEIAGATALTYTLVAADVGASIKFEVTPVAQSGVTPGLPVQSPAVGPVLPANTAPVASNVAITGTPEAGQLLTGSYNYSDVDGDLEGTSTFRWLRNDVEIAGATALTYTLVAADVGASIKFEVTPVAQTGVTPGLPAQSAGFGPVGLTGLSINDVSVAEGNAGTINASFTVTLSSASALVVTVDYVTANGTAAAGSDYVAAGPATLTFPAGTTNRPVTIVVNGDGLDEVNETFFVNLSNPTNAAIADTQGLGTITDDDAAPTLSIDDVTALEGNTGTVNASFTVTLSAVSGQEVTVDFAIADGTAIAGSDYAAGSGTLIFPAGTATQPVTVVVTGDVLDEVDETFVVNLNNATNSTIADAQGIGTITDDDDPPTLSIDDVSVLEGNTGTVNASFTVSLSAASGKAVTVDYATADGTAIAGSDYSSAMGTLTLPAGTITLPLAVTVNGDVLDEANETFFVNLSNASNATIAHAQGLCTITNDDAGTAPTVFNPTDDAYVRSSSPTSTYGTASALRVRKTGGETIISYLKFNVNGLSRAVQTAKLRLYVTDASNDGGSVYLVSNDYIGTTTPWIEAGLRWTNAPAITAGALVNAGVVTRNTWVELDVSPAITGNGVFSFAIANNSSDVVYYTSKEGTWKPELVINGGGVSTLPTVSINDVTVAEGNAGTVNANFTVTLSPASSQTVTVNYATVNGTASSGDYEAGSAVVTFPAGATSQTVTVVVNGDVIVEADETFFVNLSNATNATIADAQGLGTITNDDGASLPTLSINDVTLTEGNAGTVNANFTVTLSAASTQMTTVAFSTADGTANAGSDYLESNGTVTFPVGTTTQLVTVVINCDVSFEPDETFFVNLTNPANATVTDTQGMGTITNDDGGGAAAVFNPTDDAYVVSTSPTKNYGTENKLRVRATNNETRNAYFRFNVSGLAGVVQSAKLRLYVTDASNDGGGVYAVANAYLSSVTAWTQTGLNWNNAPAISGVALSSAGSVTVNSWVEMDVTLAIYGDGVYSFAIKNASSDVVYYTSKEGAQKPELVIQTVGAAKTNADARVEVQALPEKFSLEQNYPNPFNPTTTISFALPQASEVSLKIYNMRGQLVRTLAAGVMEAGQHKAVWDAMSDDGLRVSSGVYIYRLEASGFVANRRLVLMK